MIKVKITKKLIDECNPGLQDKWIFALAAREAGLTEATFDLIEWSPSGKAYDYRLHLNERAHQIAMNSLKENIEIAKKYLIKFVGEEFELNNGENYSPFGE